MTDAENWSPRDLVEAIKAGDVRGIAEAGMMSYDDADYIADYWQKYKTYHGKTPVEDEDDKYAKMVQRASTREFNRAVGSGNIARMAYGVGHNREDQTEIADWKEYERIKDLFRKEPQYTDFTNAVFPAFIYSSAVTKTGRGKSDFAYSLIDMGQAVHPDMVVKSNLEKDEFEDLPENWYDIRNWIRSTDGQKVILIDDASAFLQYADQKEGVVLSEELVFLRKNNTHLILIIHTGKDAPANVRRHMFAIDKQDRETAVIGSATRTDPETQEVKISNELMTVENIPETDIKYDSDDDAGYTIRFDEGESEKSGNTESNPTPDSEKIDFPPKIDENDRTARIKYMDNIGMEPEEIADYEDVTGRTVRNHLSK